MSSLAQRAVPTRPDPVVAPAEAGWSGEVHGPVAAMHRTIEASLRLDHAVGGAAALPQGPVEALLRHASRAAGWTALTLGFVGTGLLLF